MGKKYSPSGYQIIDLTIIEDDGGNPILQNSDDSKLLLNILKTGKINKPILCNIHDEFSGYATFIIGFATITNGMLTFIYPQNTGYLIYTIFLQNNDLKVEVHDNL